MAFAGSGGGSRWPDEASDPVVDLADKVFGPPASKFLARLEHNVQAATTSRFLDHVDGFVKRMTSDGMTSTSTLKSLLGLRQRVVNHLQRVHGGHVMVSGRTEFAYVAFSCHLSLSGRAIRPDHGDRDAASVSGGHDVSGASLPAGRAAVPDGNHDLDGG
jgi:hypothetical protein